MTLRSAIFSRAFEAIGIADYVFQTTAEEQASAARALDDMMAEWPDIGYVATDGEPAPDTDIDTPGWADKAISLNLALEIAPSFGKEPLAYVKGQAKKGYSLVVAKTLSIPARPGTRVPISGGGNSGPYWNSG